MARSRAKRVVLLGSKALGLRCLELLASIDSDGLAAVVTIDDRSERRSRHDDLLDVARRRAVEAITVKTRQECEGVLADLAPDLGIVAGWYWLIPKRILDTASHGYAGIHFSLLPRYRGSSPLVWALLNGDDTVGLSLFKLAAGMDDGPLWGQRSISGVDGMYVDEVLRRLEDEALDLLAEAYPRIRDGSTESMTEQIGEPTFAAPRTPDDGRLDWGAPAIALLRAVRAQSHPYPGAWTTVSGERLMIWRARPCDERWSASPGQVLRRAGDDVLVSCGSGEALWIELVSLTGDSPQPAAVAIRSLATRLDS